MIIKWPLRGRPVKSPAQSSLVIDTFHEYIKGGWAVVIDDLHNINNYVFSAIVSHTVDLKFLIDQGDRA